MESVAIVGRLIPRAHRLGTLSFGPGVGSDFRADREPSLGFDTGGRSNSLMAWTAVQVADIRAMRTRVIIFTSSPPNCKGWRLSGIIFGRTVAVPAARSAT